MSGAVHDFARAEGDDELMGLLSYAARLEIDGVPKEAMTLDLMLGLYEDDLAEIIQADGRLKEEIARFRGEKAQANHLGPDAAGDTVGDGADHGVGRGPEVAGDVVGAARSRSRQDRRLTKSSAVRKADRCPSIRYP